MKKIKLVLVGLMSLSLLVGCNEERTLINGELLDANALVGTAEGFIGEIKVEVIKDGDSISSVVVLENEETPEIAGDALEKIPAAIVDNNSPDVDIVSGATYTSKGIINAVKNALGIEIVEEVEEVEEESEVVASSGGLVGIAEGFMGNIKVEVVKDGDKITEVKILSEEETPEIAGDALKNIPLAIVEANSADVDIVAGATYTSEGIIKAVKNALENEGSTSEEAAPTDGALIGTAEGFMGDIKVEVVKDGDKITEVKILSEEETPEIAGDALKNIPLAIVEANSADVDIVVGATYTSEGIIKAVKNALGQ